MTNSTVITVLLLAAAPLARAQGEAARPAAFPHAQALRESTALAAVDGTLTGGGFDYEAAFTAAGMRFWPALGSKAPARQHLALTLVDVRRGETLVHAAGGAPVEPVASGERLVTFARGADLEERYAITPAGVELSLAFGAPLPGSGDLVARYRLATSLPSTASDADGAAFALDGVGGVSIGGVTGVDALGRRARGTIRVDGDELLLGLPGDFVAAASYPLVLDPLVGTQFLAETGGWNDMQPDVAYDATNDVYLVAFRRVFAANSIGIRAQRISGAGALVGSWVSLVSNSVNAAHPTVANLNLRDTFVVAWQQAASVWDPYDIACCAVNAATGTRSVETLVASSTDDETDPDIAGDNTTSQDEALIVYKVAGAGIRLGRVTVSAAGAQPLLASTTTVTTATTARDPAISKSPPSGGAYVMTWSEISGVTGYVRARACNRSGALLGSLVTVTSGLAGLVGVADVDGDGTNFVVAYSFGEVGAANREQNLWCRGLRWTGSALSPSTTIIPLDTTAGTDETDPAVAWCDYKFVVLYASQFLPGAYNYDVKGVELSATCTTCGPPFQLTGLNSTLLRNVEFAPAIASEIGGGAASDDALLVFAEADDSPPFTSSVIAQRYSALGAGGTIQLLGPACGVPGTMGTAGGPMAVGNSDLRITLTGAPAGIIPFLLWSFPGGETNCGSCVVVNQASATFVLPSGSGATYAYPVPCTSYAFLGVILQAQWAVLQTSANPCPSAPGLGLSFSQRLRLTIGL